MNTLNAIVVTGAASGLGQATMIALAKAGWRVAAVDVMPTSLDRLPPGCRPYACDVSDTAAVDEICTTITGDFGGISGLVNCAGIVRGGKLVSSKGPHDPAGGSRYGKSRRAGGLDCFRDL